MTENLKKKIENACLIIGAIGTIGTLALGLWTALKPDKPTVLILAPSRMIFEETRFPDFWVR
jgi:hypothetical protein